MERLRINRLRRAFGLSEAQAKLMAPMIYGDKGHD